MMIFSVRLKLPVPTVMPADEYLAGGSVLIVPRRGQSIFCKNSRGLCCVMKQHSNQKPRPRGRSSNNHQRKGNGPSRNQSFDSNGPGVRIRGSAHQVMEKYLAMARDAASQGDRVLSENYLQHAEHYFRIIQTQQPRQPRVANPAAASAADGADGPQPEIYVAEGQEGEEQQERQERQERSELPERSDRGDSPRRQTRGRRPTRRVAEQQDDASVNAGRNDSTQSDVAEEATVEIIKPVSATSSDANADDVSNQETLAV